MTDKYAELRRLAEAAPENIDEDWLGMRRGDLHRVIKPSTILSLIDDLEKAEKDAERYRLLRKAGTKDGFASDDEFDLAFDAEMASAMQEQKP